MLRDAFVRLCLRLATPTAGNQGTHGPLVYPRVLVVLAKAISLYKHRSKHRYKLLKCPMTPQREKYLPWGAIWENILQIGDDG